MKKGVLLLLVVFLVSVQVVSATCTVTFDKESYVTTESISAQMSCDNTNEKNVAYTLTWYDGNDTALELDTGTTPGIVGQSFYQSFIVPSNYPFDIIYANLSGNNMEGSDNASVSISGGGGAGNDTIILTNPVFGGGWLGVTSSVTADVTSNGRIVHGGMCDVVLLSNDESTVLFHERVSASHGKVRASFVLDYTSFKEETDYVARIGCGCFESGDVTCVANETILQPSSAIVTVPFTTHKWVSFQDADFSRSDSGNLFAGFDTPVFGGVATNNRGEELRLLMKFQLINNATKAPYGPIEGGEWTLGVGNTTGFFGAHIDAGAPAGEYYVRTVFDIYYNGINVAEYVKQTEVFHVNSTKSAMTLTGVVLRDYWGNLVNTTNVTQDESFVYPATYDDPFVQLGAGFGYQLCFQYDNNYGKPIYLYMQRTDIGNPSTGYSLNALEGILETSEKGIRLLQTGVNELCFIDALPVGVPTHSDYQIDYNAYIGDASTAFDCGASCAFTGVTDFFRVGQMDDMLQFVPWVEEQNATSYGKPGIFVVDERQEPLSMIDNCQTLDQMNISWYNDSVTCTDLDENVSRLVDYNKFVVAGESFKVCMLAKNYFSHELEVELTDPTLYHEDIGATYHLDGDIVSHGHVDSVLDAVAYESLTPSRASILDGILKDGYSLVCSRQFDMPIDAVGGNDYSVHAQVQLPSDIYEINNDIKWRLQSPKFPVYGRDKSVSYPDYITVNSYSFTHANATEGEYFQFNASVTNNLPYAVTAIFESKVLSNYGAGCLPKTFPLYSFETGEYEGAVGTAKFTLPAEATRSFKSARRIIPYGFLDENECGSLLSSFTLYVLDEQGNVLWSQAGEFSAVLDVVAKNLDVKSLQSSASGGVLQACTQNQYSMQYDNVVSDTNVYAEQPERFVVKGCVKDTTQNIYLHCSVFEVEPDDGVNKSGVFVADAPFVYANTTAGVDVWVYSYDSENADEACLHCGKLVDFYRGPAMYYFNITPDLSDECKFTATREEELTIRGQGFLERIANAFEGLYAAVVSWFAGVDATPVGNYTNVTSSIPDTTIGADALVVNYTITAVGADVTARKNLHFVYEFAPVESGVEGAFYDQNPNLQGYQALDVYQAMLLNETKSFSLTLDPSLVVGTYKVYETVYEFDAVPRTDSDGAVADERVIHQGTYVVTVDASMVPVFSGDVIQFSGVSMTAIS